MTEFEKMQLSLDYDDFGPELTALKESAFRLLQEINQCQFGKAAPLFKKLLKSVTEKSFIYPPFRCEYGKTISIGESSFINMGATMLDNAPITIGNHVLVGPNAQFYTVSHPTDYRKRRDWEVTCLPITVEDDVWIGGNVVICQGVTIGARSVVAAGAVVTKDVAPDTMVGGQPAKLIKRLD
ncbi:sugar O-acetyltransferase [Psychromonas antarctica]|uniref:sugar O-acetyltransferase n=1 Tax=Psychromonas antarctica TaxID=67573 RepID=UPI001EE96C60|nr:sugar O-acetyltransferase [Psychromonas antarctica]MCG6201548.1 sugar O-acetyltransferase [Psychromonas antarctica]